MWCVAIMCLCFFKEGQLTWSGDLTLGQNFYRTAAMNVQRCSTSFQACTMLQAWKQVLQHNITYFAAMHCKLLQLLQPPINSRQHLKSGFQHRKPRQERTAQQMVKKIHLEQKVKRLIAPCCKWSQHWNGCADNPGTISIGKSGLD